MKFAWDTQSTWRGRGMNAGDKVFRNGPVVFGVAGSARVADIIRHMDVPPFRKGAKAKKAFDPPKGFDTRRWIVRELIPAIIEATTKADAAYLDSGQIDTETNTIIAVNGLLGYLSGDLSFVQEDIGAYAVGSGSEYALGALAVGATAKQAVKVAAAFDMYTGGEVRGKSLVGLMK